MSVAASDIITAARFAPRPVTWHEAAILAGRVPQGGFFETVRKELREKGLESWPSNDLCGEDDWSPDAIAERLAAKFLGKACAPSIFLALYHHGPLTKERAAERVGVAARGGHWETGWKAIRRSPLVRQVGDDSWDVAEILRELKASS